MNAYSDQLDFQKLDSQFNQQLAPKPMQPIGAHPSPIRKLYQPPAVTDLSNASGSRSTSLPPPMLPRVPSRRTQEAIDMANGMNSFIGLYPEASTSAVKNEYDDLTSSTSRPGVVRRKSSNLFLNPHTDHPFSQQEQFEMLERIRRDLYGVDINTLTGPFKELAEKSQALAAAQGMSWTGSSIPGLPSQTNQTVSPQEAFLDYEDIMDDHGSDPTPAQPLFAPLPGSPSAAALSLDQYEGIGMSRNFSQPGFQASRSQAGHTRSLSAEPSALPPFADIGSSSQAHSPATYAFTYPKNAMSWQEPKPSSQTKLSVDTKAPKKQTSIRSIDSSLYAFSEDESAPQTPIDPSLQISNSYSNYFNQLRNPSMPFLSRAADESFQSQRGRLPEVIPDDPSPATSETITPFPSTATSTKSSYFDRDSSASTTPSVQQQSSTRNKQPLPPSMSLSGEIRTDTSALLLPQAPPASFIAEDDDIPVPGPANPDLDPALQHASAVILPVPQDYLGATAQTNNNGTSAASTAMKPPPPARANARGSNSKRKSSTIAYRPPPPPVVENGEDQPIFDPEAEEEEEDDADDDGEYKPPADDSGAGPSTRRRRSTKADPTAAAPQPDSADEEYIDEAEFDDEERPKKKKRKSKATNDDGTPRKPATPRTGGSIICDFEDPISGKVCGTAFRRPYDLARHKDTIHTAAELKPSFTCQNCQHSFSRRDALLRHQRQRGHQ